MPHIIVTTPKSESANAAQEAANARINGGYYFRVLSSWPKLFPGESVFYVENGYIRGFAEAHALATEDGNPVKCDVTGREWRGKCVVWMRVESWKWIKPIAMRGFQGFRYAEIGPYEIVGGWQDAMPEVK